MVRCIAIAIGLLVGAQVLCCLSLFATSCCLTNHDTALFTAPAVMMVVMFSVAAGTKQLSGKGLVTMLILLASAFPGLIVSLKIVGWLIGNPRLAPAIFGPELGAMAVVAAAAIVALAVIHRPQTH
jgi:hypothetical protein